VASPENGDAGRERERKTKEATQAMEKFQREEISTVATKTF